MIKFREFAYGSTSAVITSLAIIISLSGTINSKFNIIAALLIIAIADNVSDAFAIHLQEESQKVSTKEVRKTTFYNFLARLLITTIFVIIIFFIPTTLATIISIIYGLGIITFLSYNIAKSQKKNPYKEIAIHVGVAIILMIVSIILKQAIMTYVKS